MIDIKGHLSIWGRTRSGKTYFALKELEKIKQGVLFVNTKKQTSDLEKYIEVLSRDISLEQLTTMLKRGYKINLIMTSDEKDRLLGFLIKKLIDSPSFTEKNYIILAIDEIHLYKCKDELTYLASVGVSCGIYGAFITQRPAYQDNNLITQSENFIIFSVNMEREYFKRYGIPYDEIVEKLKDKKYHYIEFDGLTVSEAKKANK